MPSNSLNKMVYGFLTLLMGLLALSAIVVTGFFLFMFSDRLNIINTFDPVAYTVPIQFVPEPDRYSLISEDWGNGEITLANGSATFSAPSDYSFADFGATLAASLFYTMLIFLILLLLRRIFGSMVKDTPFIQENVNRIRWIGVLVVGVNLLAQAIEILIRQAVRLNIESSGLKLMNQNSIDGGIVVVGLIIFALAEVFRYGIELQSESDLTV